MKYPTIDLQRDFLAPRKRPTLLSNTLQTLFLNYSPLKILFSTPTSLRADFAYNRQEPFGQLYLPDYIYSAKVNEYHKLNASPVFFFLDDVQNQIFEFL